MRFMIQIVDKHHQKHGIPAVVDAAGIDDAIDEFVRVDAGRYLKNGYMIQVTDVDRKRHNYLYSNGDKPKWIPTL